MCKKKLNQRGTTMSFSPLRYLSCMRPTGISRKLDSNFSSEIWILVENLKSVSVLSYRSNSQSAVAPVRISSSFTETLNGVSRRRKVHDFTDASKLGVHVNRAKLKKKK